MKTTHYISNNNSKSTKKIKTNKMNYIVTLIILLSSLYINAQDVKKEVYKGTLNDKIITLYLQSEEHPCIDDDIYYGMYQYNSSNGWIQLKVSKNDKNQFVFVEYNFTGILILEKNNSNFNGLWISPDSKKQLNVLLKKVELSKEELNEYQNIFERVNYENNDC